MKNKTVHVHCWNVSAKKICSWYRDYSLKISFSSFRASVNVWCFRSFGVCHRVAYSRFFTLVHFSCFRLSRVWQGLLQDIAALKITFVISWCGCGNFTVKSESPKFLSWTFVSSGRTICWRYFYLSLMSTFLLVSRLWMCMALLSVCS